METRRTSARKPLSAIAATLLACGGAALIAGAPDWVTRLARVIAVTFSQRGSSQEQLAEAIRPAAPGAGAATTADQIDLVTVDNRTLENRQDTVH